MKTYTLFALICLSLLTPSLFGQTTLTPFQQALADYNHSDTSNVIANSEIVIRLAVAMDQLPPIPEEARKHFVIGTTLFKDAKTQDDYKLVIDEFRQAVHLAPWWPDARYNLALSCETAGSYYYLGAIANLHLYQLFKLSDTESRTVQDKIYVLEAKVQKVKDEYQQKKLLTAAEEANPYIGKKMGGGIVFYIDKTGQHGFIAAPSDQGRGNWFQAVQLCKDYRGGGYSDWFMPLKGQLFALYQVRSAVGGFVQALYWTSSEGRRGAARDGVWIEGWDDGKLYDGKDPNYIYDYVRAIRAF